VGYRHRPNVQGRVLRRQKALALSDEARQIAWRAQQRLYKRYIALTSRGKTSGQAMTALARELLGFVWAIAVHTEKQFQLPKAA
jgi:transposase